METPDSLSVALKPGSRPGVQILHLSGPATIHNLYNLQTVARDYTGQALIIDLADVPYLDSAVVGTLVGIHVSSERHGRKYAITGVNARIRTIFSVCKVDQFLAIYQTVEAAEAALGD